MEKNNEEDGKISNAQIFSMNFVEVQKYFKTFLLHCFTLKIQIHIFRISSF